MVSVIMPVRNEADTIRTTIASLLKQDYPVEMMEIIIADGLSTDGTDEVIRQMEAQYNNVRYLPNTGKIVSTGLNLAIQKSVGEVIVRMDAHSVYPNDYISKLVQALDEYNADNVGCVIETIPANDTLMAKAIAIGLSSPFGVGNSKFRVGVKEAMEVDTVPFGCFRREVFDKIGWFDEELIRNQDDEFNARMLRNGCRIVLIPDITCRYQARDSYRKLSAMLFQYGLFKPLVNWKLGQIATFRQLVPMLLILFVAGGALISLMWPVMLSLYFSGIIAYLLFISVGSLKAFRTNKTISLIPFCLITFPIMHVSYGWGYSSGLWKLFFRKGLYQKEIRLSR